MRLKRYIALLLTTVYLFAVGGPSFASLTCRCVSPAEPVQQPCCSLCDDDSGFRPAMHEPCCGDRHSIDVALYTSSSHDAEKFVKRIVAPDLPDALAAESVVGAGPDGPIGCDRIVPQDRRPLPTALVASCGLRAPPVLV